MTNEELDTIAERAAAASPGPWDADGGEPEQGVVVSADPLKLVCNVTRSPLAANTEFIAAARQDIPALVEEVRSLQKELDAAHRELGAFRHGDMRPFKTLADVDRVGDPEPACALLDEGGE